MQIQNICRTICNGMSTFSGLIQSLWLHFNGVGGKLHGSLSSFGMSVPVMAAMAPEPCINDGIYVAAFCDLYLHESMFLTCIELFCDVSNSFLVVEPALVK